MYAYICIYVYICIIFVLMFMFTFHCLMYFLFNVVYASHIRLSVFLFHKCIWSHANFLNGACFCNSLQSLAIDCVHRELHCGFLHCFCMSFWLFCLMRSHWFVNAVVEGLI